MIGRGCAVCLIVVLSCFAGRSIAKQAKAPKSDPEGAIRPLRALLAISEEPVKPGSSCDQGRLIATKKGSQQVGDILAIILAYHSSGINTVTGSCDNRGDSSCSVSFKHRKNSQSDQEFVTFKFKVLNGKAYTASLECEMSP